MSEKFYLSFAGEGVEELKAAIGQVKEIEELEVESLTEEIVACLIEAQTPIQSLVLEEMVIDGALLTKLLSSLSVSHLVFPSYEACEAECEFDECDDDIDECKEKKKEHKESLKFKGLIIQTQKELENVVEQLVEEKTVSVKFKECRLSDEFLLWMVSELVSGELKHLEKISISKDPKAVAFLKGRDIPAGISIEPKKKDGITLLRTSHDVPAKRRA